MAGPHASLVVQVVEVNGTEELGLQSMGSFPKLLARFDLHTHESSNNVIQRPRAVGGQCLPQLELCVVLATRTLETGTCPRADQGTCFFLSDGQKLNSPYGETFLESRPHSTHTLAKNPLCSLHPTWLREPCEVSALLEES